MKKVMLFIASMLFAVSANAATMSWVLAPTIDLDNNSVQITAHEGYDEDEGSHTDNFVFNVDELVQISAVAIEFYDDQLDIANVTLDGASIFNFTTLGGGVSEWLSSSVWLAAGDHTIALVVNSALAGAQLNVKVNAVPVPAALFLFAPALLGFLGLRRKATLAA